jgi:hypothetical protein
MYGNNMQYQRPFNNIITQQNMYDQIDNEINNLQQMKERMKNSQLQQPQPTSINQTFQLAPNNREIIKYANSYEEVQREVVVGETPFFSKDMSVVWVKNAKGEVKTYELNEIVQKDEKDIKIDFLMAQIEELKKGMKKDESNSIINEPITDTNESKEPTNVSNVPKLPKKSK